MEKRIKAILHQKKVHLFNQQYLFDMFLQENNMDPNTPMKYRIYQVAKQYFKQKYSATVADYEFSKDDLFY